MTFYKTKEASEKSGVSYINIIIIGEYLVLNQTGKLPNELFEFKDYNKMLDIISYILDNNQLERVKDFLKDNCPQVERLINSVDNKGQISLF